jgi:hypothetical protein
MFAGISHLVADSVGLLFALAGIINLSGHAQVRMIYRFWHYPRGFYRIVGVVELLTALFLIAPELRIWGVALAAPIAFFSVVTLLNHRQYLWSLPGMLLLMALVPASMA